MSSSVASYSSRGTAASSWSKRSRLSFMRPGKKRKPMARIEDEPMATTPEVDHAATDHVSHAPTEFSKVVEEAVHSRSNSLKHVDKTWDELTTTKTNLIYFFIGISLSIFLSVTDSSAVGVSFIFTVAVFLYFNVAKQYGKAASGTFVIASFGFTVVICGCIFLGHTLHHMQSNMHRMKASLEIDCGLEQSSVGLGAETVKYREVMEKVINTVKELHVNISNSQSEIREINDFIEGIEGIKEEISNKYFDAGDEIGSTSHARNNEGLAANSNGHPLLFSAMFLVLASLLAIVARNEFKKFQERIERQNETISSVESEKTNSREKTAGDETQTEDDENAAAAGLTTFASDNSIVSLNDFAALTETSLQTESHLSDVYALIGFKLHDMQYIASGHRDGSIKVCKVEDGSLLTSLTGHTSHIWSLTVYEKDNAKYLASGSGDNTIKLWNLETGTLVATLSEHCGSVFSLALYQEGDDSFLVSGSSDMTVNVWCLKSHTRVATLEGHTDWVYALTIYNLDGVVHLASGSKDKSVKIWNIKDRSLIATLTGHTDAVISLSVLELPTKTILVSGSYDKTIRLRDLDNNSCVGTLYGHTDTVFTLLVVNVSDKMCLVSGSHDGTVKIWNLDSRVAMTTLDFDNRRVHALESFQFEDTVYMVAGGEGGRIQAWKE